MFDAINQLPEKTRNRVVLMLWIGFIVLLVLAFVGAQIARGPLPEMIIAPADSYSVSASEAV